MGAIKLCMGHGAPIYLLRTQYPVYKERDVTMK